ncbi:MAG TPA: hypothetical protein VLC98_13620 [Phnomibacter sp.]|nr:hypothetical protein [Phnomibacter sp.]
MPGNHDFERAMQQQLDGFRVNPSPSDWQAVYEQLHPPKKRRPIWWWIPGLLVMVAIGWYMAKEPAGTGQAIPSGKASHLQLKKQDSTQAENKTASPTTSAVLDETLASTGKEEIETHSSAQTNQQFKQSDVESIDGKKTEEKNATTTDQPATDLFDIAASFIASGSDKKVNTINEDEWPIVEMETTEAAAAKTEMAEAAQLPTPIQYQPAVENKWAQPKTKKAHAWTWGVYAGAGFNNPTEPISGAKAMMDYSSSSPNGSYQGASRLVTSSSQQNGGHYNAGILLNRKWHRNWQFTAGLGVNLSTWQTNSTTYKDSILANGAQYNSILQVQEQKKYSMYMFELPLQISNRIAGKGEGSFWWTAGINNQFLLNLHMNTTSQNLLNNFMAFNTSQSGTSGAATYQPQLRLGFLYDHAGSKSHWQLVPMINLGFGEPIQNQSFHFNNYQLQGRWFFSK